MKNILKFVDNFRNSVDRIEKFFLAIFAVLAGLGTFFTFVTSSHPVAVFIRDNLIWIWLITLTVFAFVVLHRVSNLNRRFVSGFSVNLSTDLTHVWEFQGPTPWSTTPSNELIVTNSHVGGITKVGHYWENYDLTFKAHIINQCLGVIIRAESLNSYYMLQINKNNIVPHKRTMVKLNEPSVNELENGNFQIEPVRYLPAWEIHEPVALSNPIEGWFDAKVTVKGDTVFLLINGMLVFEQKGFLQIPSGKIGFRNDGKEKALVKNIRVQLHPYY